jgi:dynein heavy chain
MIFEQIYFRKCFNCNILIFSLTPQNPPPVVKLVMESICVMFAFKPERKPDPSGSGKMVEDYWGPSQKFLGDMKFLDKLKAYDKDNIAPAVIKKIRDR